MATQSINPVTTEERLIWFGLVATYPIYFLGGLYVSGSVLGYLILAALLLRLFVEGNQNTHRSVPAMAWLWIIAMLVMLIALWAGHANWGLGMGKTIKSTIGWAKGWALIALFIFLGAVLPLRKELIIRGVCILGWHTFLFSAFTFIAYMLRLPGELFVSPLQIVGGPGPNFFTVSLYGLNPETGGGRWQFFGPWAPAAGLLACIYLVICLQEEDKTWRTRGILGATAMCLLCQSRAGWAIFICLWPMVVFSDKFREPWFLLVIGFVVPLILVLGQPVLEFVLDSYEQVKQSRPGSTRVRQALATIAIQRWESEAYWFGHGVVERGPKLVEGMPIGSHHSWYGLLFVKGLVGLLALAIPMFISAIYLFIYSQVSKIAQTALCLLAVFICYSFFENLEILSYLYWPALLWIGMAFNPLNTLTREERSGSKQNQSEQQLKSSGVQHV
ncbi:O-antigen ligase family protein [Planctobacterium marinum]|uniref:Capsular biosynthesis protein n=1 Tax=Planctobacterium marinum TaxID=1631968 RepID=A0AA48KU63_9ALTE|nr:hypothetical protein MACH26_37750 [Planctobacterium marinum]